MSVLSRGGSRHETRLSMFAGHHVAAGGGNLSLTASCHTVKAKNSWRWCRWIEKQAHGLCKKEEAQAAVVQQRCPVVGCGRMRQHRAGERNRDSGDRH